MSVNAASTSGYSSPAERFNHSPSSLPTYEPPGPLPNDLINEVSVKPIDSPKGESVYLFELYIGSVDKAAKTTEVVIEIEAGRAHLEDATRSAEAIRAQ